MTDLQVLGVSSGIGSIQYGFQRAGWRVLHAHEHREVFHTGTFEANYGEELHADYEPDLRYRGVDCIVSHPSCSNFSSLYVGKDADEREKDGSSFSRFITTAQAYQPKVFLIENLPRSLKAIPKEQWREWFVDYNVYFEYVSNWGYGNVQRNRNRLFIIGVHKDLDWQFVPYEQEHDRTIRDVISGIADDAPNHKIMQLDDRTQWRGYQIGRPELGPRVPLKDMQQWFSDAGFNATLPYYNRKGEFKKKIGNAVLSQDRTSWVLTGGGAFFDSHWIFDDERLYYRPLTMRERLRIQGFGDDFILVPLDFEFRSPEHQFAVQQTGKCIPVEFPTFFARQLKQYLTDGTYPTHEPKRLLRQI